MYLLDKVVAAPPSRVEVDSNVAVTLDTTLMASIDIGLKALQARDFGVPEVDVSESPHLVRGESYMEARDTVALAHATPVEEGE